VSLLRAPAARASRAALVAVLATASPALAQAPLRQIGQMKLSVLGVSATVDPLNPTVPKNIEAGVRIVVSVGGAPASLPDAARFFGVGFTIQGELSGPGLTETQTLSTSLESPDPFVLRLPALPTSGDYDLSNLRIVSAQGQILLEVQPRHVTVKVIEQVLITSVKTRPLTLDEIRQKGIVLDSDDYFAFEFTLGLKLESKTVDISFPVAFDRNGVPVPQFLMPPPAPSREVDLPPLPAIVPVLFEVEDGGAGPGGGARLPVLPNGGGEVRIPSVIVIPGQVGYLKQFFSAKLYVANGAPGGSGLSVRDITGTIKLPLGPDQRPNTSDDPLALPTLLRDGHEITQPLTMDVRGVGPDTEPGTADDEASLAPGAQGEAEFLLRGEHEGFHTIDFDIKAVLDGLVTGPVRIKGKASGAVLVRNPFFDVSFTVPGVVRAGETFKVFVTLTNLGEATANKVNLTLPAGVGPSGARLVGDLPPEIPSIGPRESKTLTLQFLALRTGQVVASYLQFDPQDEDQQRPTGSLRLAVGIGERGVPLSPDTLVLPAAVDELPSTLVEAAMRVLGQAWSIANAPQGTLPRDVIRTSRTVVTQKALALAEAGLRVSLGQPERDALRDVVFDFWGGPALDAGFDQLLRTTEAGDELRRALGAALGAGDGALDPLGLESAMAKVAASGPDFVSFAIARAPGASLSVSVFDAAGHQTAETAVAPGARPPSEVPSAVLLPLGAEADDPLLGVVASASGGPYGVALRSAVGTTVGLSVTFSRGDGTFVHADFPGINVPAGAIVRAALDQTHPDRIILDLDEGSVAYGGMPFESEGPNLVSATLIGPETLQGASPFGFQMVALFDRIVEAESAQQKEGYQVPKNGIQGAKRQLSGRLVFLSLAQPEGPYVPTMLSVLGGVADPRGKQGLPGSVSVSSRLRDPGAIVTGHVFQADGTPVTSGVVTYVNNSDLSCFRPNETGFAALPLDAQGRYEFRFVRQDNCGLPFKIVTQDPATNGRREVSALVRAAGEAITLDLALFGRGSVQGTVKDLTGHPVATASVVAVSQTDPQIGGTATTDGVGHYRIDGITVGPVVVRAGKGSGLGSAPGRIDHAGTVATVDVVLDGGAVKVFGVVQKLEAGAESPEPVPGAYVVFKHFDAQNPFGVTLGVAQTGLQGRYEFTGMPVGDFQVSTQITGQDGDTQPGRAVLGVDSEVNLLVRIPPPAQLATVKGHVYLPDAQTPAADVVVSINNRGVVSADGSFTIPGVPVSPTAQTVTARTRDGRRSGSTTVVASQPREYDNLEIVLSGLGTGAFRVLDEKGLPVKNQQVAILGNCGNPCGCRVADTDTDGIAGFEDLSYGSFTAQALRSGTSFTDVTQASLSIVADDTTVLSTMRYAGAGAVEGTVRDHLGNPLFGADVVLHANHFVYDGATTCGLQNGYAARTRTDLQGHYKFAGVNVGVVSVSATQPFVTGSAGNRGQIAKAGDVATLDVKFDDTMAGILKGTVFRPGSPGVPVGEGVEVAVEGPLPEVKATTLADGTYEFPHILPAGYYQLTARDPVGGGLARLTVALKRQEDLVQDVHLKGRGSVHVLAVEGDDVPLPSALVRLQEKEFPLRSFDQTLRPENHGIVTFLDVYEGAVRIDVSDPFARSGSATVVLPGPDQEVSVKVKVTPTGRVTGRFLMPAGTPIPYGTVKLTAGSRVIGQATTLGSGDVGRFAFDYVPVGPVTLEAQDPLTARTGSAMGTLDHEGDPPLQLDVKAQGLGRVVGTVRRGGQEQGLARVDLVSGAYKASTLTDGQGNYIVEGVPEGRVTVTASLSSQGFLAGSNSAALEGDGQEIRIDVALRDAGSVKGRVVPASQADRDAGRYPPTLVKLYVGGTGGGAQQANTRTDGTFSFELVPVGHVTFTADVVDSIDQGSAVLDVAPGENSVEIPLNGVGSLTGKVVKADAPDEGVDGWVTFSGTAFPSGAIVQVGNDGLFALPEVLAGEFTARAQHGQGPLLLYGTASGVVRPEEPTDVKVVLQPSGTIRGTVFRPAATADGKRPAFGAQVTILLLDDAGHSRGQIPLLVQENGSYSVNGVPHGNFAVRVFDPISNGRAARDGFRLEGGEIVVPEILIDDQPPAPVFVEPAEGSVRRRFGGGLVIDVAGGDVDPTSIVVRYPTGAYQLANEFAYANGRFTGGLAGTDGIRLGSNRLTVTVKDLAGNSGNAEVNFVVEGGTVKGRVIGSDGQPAAGIPVKLDSFDLVTDPSGFYRKDGQRSGNHQAQATDPATGLQSPMKGGFLEDGGVLVLDDLVLPAAGSIAGKVVHANASDAEAGISVVVGGKTYLTEAGGAFTTSALLPNSYTIEATAPNGDRGHASVEVAAGAPTPATVYLNGVGSVTVTVKNASGEAVKGAQVTVTTTAPFASPAPKATDALGVASFSVLAGTVTVKADYLGLEGTAAAQVLLDTKHLDFTVALEPSARIVGTVRRWNGPAVAATVKLSGPRTETKQSNPDGTFEFTDVHFGEFRIEAEALDGDRGVTKGTVSQPTPPAFDVVLAGFRDLTVTVKDVQDQPVSGAIVTVTSAAFGFLDFKSTNASGQAPFVHLPAGAMDVEASKSPLTTKKTITLPPGDPMPFALTIRLDNTGSIAGVVHAPGGGDGVAGVVISAGGRSTTSGAGGAYLLDGLAPGSYLLEARLDGFLRARASLVPVVRGETTDLPLELVGIGTVKGVVSDHGAPVDGASVLITVPGVFGGQYPFTTSASGEYQLARIPVQPEVFTVTAHKGTTSADATGRIVSHGQVLSLDLDLLPNAIQVPATLADGNGLAWTVQPDGSVRGPGPFTSQAGGPRLSLSQGQQVSTFVGRGEAGLEETEEGKREIVLHQDGLRGLKVTRKVFVPRGGYFIRYLEVLENAGDSAVEVDVSLDSTLTSAWTQAGSPALVPPASPGFAVVDDADTRDFYDFGSQIPPFAVALAGSDAGTPEVGLTGHELRYRWSNVVVPAHGKTVLLHVWTVQADRGRAQASGTRLTALPPEVLAGMSVEEGQEVRNFTVPPDMVSALAALPPNDGIVTGRVLTGDGQTPLSASPRFKSRSPHYGRPLDARILADKSFRLEATADAIVPREAFDLKASWFDGFVQQATATGDFPSAGVVELSAASGAVLAASSTWPGYSLANLTDSDLTSAWFSAPDDSFDDGKTPSLELGFPKPATVHVVRVRGQRNGPGFFVNQARLELLGAGGQLIQSIEPVDLPAPAHDADIVLPSPVAGVRTVRFTALQGDRSPGLAEFQVFGEGDFGPVQHAAQDVLFTGTAPLEVRVLRADGSPLEFARIHLSGPVSLVDKTTDSNGLATYFVVPPGAYALQAKTVSGGAPVSALVEVVAGQKKTVLLTFPALGTVSGSLHTFAGLAIGGSVNLTGPNQFSQLRFVSTNDNGQFEFTDVPAGVGYAVKATDSTRSQAVVTTAPFPVAAGQNAIPVIVFPAVGTIDLTTVSGGQPFVGATVRWRSPASRPDWQSASTGIGGKVTLNRVPGPTVEMEISRPDLPLNPEKRTVTIDAEAKVVVLTVDLPGTTSLSGTVRSLSGVAYPGAFVRVWNEAGNTPLAQAFAGANAAFTLTVPPGRVRLRAYESSCGEAGEVLVDLATTSTADALYPRGTIARPGQRDFWQIDLASSVPFVSIYQQGAADAIATPIEQSAPRLYRPDGNEVAMPFGAFSGTLATGRYLVAAGGPPEGIGGYRLCASNAAVGRWAGPRVTGHALAGGDPLAGHRVRLVRPNLPDVESATDDSGAFELPLLLPGDFTIEVVDAAGVVVARQTGSVEPGGDAQVDLAAPARAHVTVHVVRADADVPGILVTLQSSNPDALPTDALREVTTGSDGRASADVPSGSVTAIVDAVATACDKGPQGPAPCLQVADAPADFTFDLPDLSTTVIVRVTASDGLTPLPHAYASIDEGPPTPLDIDGVVRFEGVPGGRRQVHAHGQGGRHAVQQIDLAGGEVTVPLSLPMPVIRTTFIDSHGGPVSSGILEARGTVKVWRCNSWGFCQWQTESRSQIANPSAGGVYVFDELETWQTDSPIYLTGRPLRSNVSASLSPFSVDSASSTIYEKDLQLPPTGALLGTVVAADGSTLVAGAEVLISTDDGPPVEFVAEDGTFAAPYIQPGSVAVYGNDPVDGIPGRVDFTLAADEQKPVQVMLAPSATLVIQRVDAGNLIDEVTVQAPEAARRPGTVDPWLRTLDVSGGTGVPIHVPAGLYQVLWPPFSSGCPNAAAAAEGVTAPGETQVELDTKGYVPLPAILSGAAASYGSTRCGPKANPILGGDVMANRDYPWVGKVLPEEATGSEVRAVRTLLATSGDGLRARREQFVPASGAFARSVTFVSQTGNTPRTEALVSTIRLGGEWRVETTSDDDEEIEAVDTFAVLTDGADRVGLLLGFGIDRSASLSTQYVCGGESRPSSSASKVGLSSFSCYETIVEIRETLSVPTDGTAVATFTLARPGLPLEEVVFELDSLLDQESVAFEGLSPEERALIHNFPPPGPPTGLMGVVKDANGNPVASALVGVSRGGLLLAQRTASAEGAFTIKGLSPGPVTVVARHPDTNRPGKVDADVEANVVTDLGELALLGDAVVGTVKVTAEWESQEVAAGETVEVVPDGYAGLWSVQAVTGPDGTATAEGVPPGAVTARWGADASLREDSGALAPGGLVELHLVLPASGVDVEPMVDLTGQDGQPFFVGGDGQAYSNSFGSCTPFCGSLPKVDGSLYPGGSPLRLVRGREVFTPPVEMSGLLVRRRVYVPADGGYVRIIDVITKPDTGPDLPVNYELSSHFDGTEQTWVVEATSDGDSEFAPTDTFAVFRNVDSGLPTVALVRGGQAAGFPNNATWNNEGALASDFTYWDELHVAPGQTVMLMQFVVKVADGPDSAQQATDLAQGLVDLSLPGVLFGLSPSERHSILNFSVQ
jgi:hypothetical protein